MIYLLSQKKGRRTYAALPFFSIVLKAAAAAVHDTWGEDGEENIKEERNFTDSWQEAADTYLIPIYSKHQSGNKQDQKQSIGHAVTLQRPNSRCCRFPAISPTKI